MSNIIADFPMTLKDHLCLCRSNHIPSLSITKGIVDEYTDGYILQLNIHWKVFGNQQAKQRQKWCSGETNEYNNTCPQTQNWEN